MPILSFGDRLKNAWSVFNQRSTSSTQNEYIDYGISSGYRPDRPRLVLANERTIISAIYNRIAIDVASVPIKHVRVDQNGRYQETIKSGLNSCLNLSANVDQTGRELILDIVLSMFDEGCVAVVPVETSVNITTNSSFDIHQLRVGKIVRWYPQNVSVSVYNETTGKHEEITLPKETVAIIENPLYTVMNDNGSTVKRLLNKMALLDVVDKQSGSSKLDLIIQLPYTIKTERKQEEANKRKKQIEDQLENSKYGVAYIDSTEKITQLNRSLENNLMGQVEYLTNLLYSQLGITKEVFDGNADEKQMLNYYNRTIEPILAAISDEMMRKFLTKTARTQGQSLQYIRDPFKLVAVGEIAEIADKFSRNEILSSNELRGIVGFMPSDQPNADELYNPNMPRDNSFEEENSEDFENSEDVENFEGSEDLQMLKEQIDNLDDGLNQLDSISKEYGLEDNLEEDELKQSDVLAHYASPYYDPVKAHEYYERTKKLKNRRSTAGLNEEGKKVAKYVRKSLNEERKKKIAEAKQRMQDQIDDLMYSLKGMSGEERALKKAELQYKIASLRKNLKDERDRLKAEYDELYYKELDAIKADKSMQKVKKSRRRRR